LQFSLQKDIFNHRDVCCCFFFNNGEIFFLLNIYSDLNQSALKYLKDTEVNICNFLIMTGDFNIRDSIWDLDYSYYLVYSNLLFDIANVFNLSFLHPTHSVLTKYSDNSKNLNSVINLMFLRPNSLELDNHSILPKSQYLSDHVPLVVDIQIIKEFIPDIRCIIIKNSEEEMKFTSDVIKNFKNIDILHLISKESLEVMVQEITRT